MLKIYGLIILGSLLVLYGPMNAIINSDMPIHMKILILLCTGLYLLEGVSDIVLKWLGYKE